MQHGWFVRGKRSKQFVGKSDDGVQGSVLRAFALPADATMFPSAQAAQAFADGIVMAPDLEVVDMVIHDPLPPDADQSPVRTFAQVRQDALDEDAPREAQRRATWSLIQKAAVALVAAVFCGTLLCGWPAAASPLFPPIFGATHAGHVSHSRAYAAHYHRARTRAVLLHSGRRNRAHGPAHEVAHEPAPQIGSLAIASRYLGGNPTGHASLWCADFANFVERQLGRVGTGSREALSFLRYGPHVANPAPGDIVVLGRHGGGHVGFLIKQTPHGPLIISGNHGHRVGIGVYPPGRVIAYVRPA